MYSLQEIQTLISSKFEIKNIKNIENYVIRFKPLSQWKGLSDDINWHHWSKSKAVYFNNLVEVDNNALKFTNCDSIMNGGNSSSDSNEKFASEVNEFDMIIIKTNSYNHNDGSQTEFMVYKKEIVKSKSSKCQKCNIEEALKDAAKSFPRKDKYYVDYLESLVVES
jgi:hypothetical protein